MILRSDLGNIALNEPVKFEEIVISIIKRVIIFKKLDSVRNTSICSLLPRTHAQSDVSFS